MSSATVTDEASSAPRQVGLAIGGMTCAACAARVEKKLNGIDSVVATVNFATGQALVTAPASVPARRLIDALEQVGYRAEVLTSGMAAAGGESGAEAAGGGPDVDRVIYLRNRLLVAVVFFVPLGDLWLPTASGCAGSALHVLPTSHGWAALGWARLSLMALSQLDREGRWRNAWDEFGGQRQQPPGSRGVQIGAGASVDHGCVSFAVSVRRRGGSWLGGCGGVLAGGGRSSRRRSRRWPAGRRV